LHVHRWSPGRFGDGLADDDLGLAEEEPVLSFSSVRRIYVARAPQDMRRGIDTLGIGHHLGHHVPADPEMPGGLSLAMSIDDHVSADLGVQFHGVHPSP
jgi:hypothetical protein